MRRLICSVIAVALLLLARTTRASTIQPVLVSITPSGGNFIFEYEVSLTANNGLAGSSAAGVVPSGYESGLLIPDFQGYVAGSIAIQSLGGDATSIGDWVMNDPVNGASPLNNSANIAGVSTSIVGFPPGNPTGLPVATVVDSSLWNNLVLQYQGSGLAVSGSSRVLIHLYATSTTGSVSMTTTLSRDTGPGSGQRQVETFSAFIPDFGGGPFLPLPSTAGMGLVLLGGLGFGRVRRMKLA